MFKGLQSIVKESLTITSNRLAIDLVELDGKTTIIFVSSEFAEIMTGQAKSMETMSILESDSKKVDLIFQWADEIYRCYMKEARDDFELGDLFWANIKKECANQIHNELKRIYNPMCKDDHSKEKSVDTRTT